MTIRNVNLNDRLSNLQECAFKAPKGTYETAKSIALAIDGAIESVRAEFKAFGFKADAADHCRDLEAAIYGFFIASNPQFENVIVTAEGFGQHVNGPAGARIIEQAKRDRDFLISQAKNELR